MEKPTPNRTTPQNKIPELNEVIQKYGSALGDKPKYVLVGNFFSKSIGPVMGIIAASHNEMHAHILKREINKNGEVTVEKSEYHPDGQTFSISDYYKKIQDMRAASSTERK
jgi:hypothetical protein